MVRGFTLFHVVTPVGASWPGFSFAPLTIGASEMVRELANILIRQANKTQNARNYLDALVTAQYTTVAAQGGVIVSTTVNGKSVTFQAMPGTTVADVMRAAELALQSLEAGLSRVPGQTYALFR